MLCPQCGAENDASRQSCVRCGRLLLLPNTPRPEVVPHLQQLRPTAGQPPLMLLLALALLTVLLMAFLAQWGLRQASTRSSPQQALANPTQPSRVVPPSLPSPTPSPASSVEALLPRLTILPTEVAVTATPQPPAEPTTAAPTPQPPTEPNRVPPTLVPTTEPPPPPRPTTPSATVVPALPAITPSGRTRPGPALTAARIAAPPRVDGSLNEWTSDGTSVSHIVYGAENWSGPADLSGKVWLGWDDQALYLAAWVVDDVVSQLSRGSAMYLGDSVEIQWDTDLAGDFDSNEFNADDWHIGISPGNFENLPPEVYIWTPQAGAGDRAGVQYAARPIVTNGARQGYTVEVAIPWTLVNVTPHPGRAFGLTFAISDNDVATPVQQTMLATTPNRQWHRPLTFNPLTLNVD